MAHEITIEGRGETVRYRDGSRYLFASLSNHGTCTLDTWDARHWQEPEGVRLSEIELAIVTKRITEYLTSRGLSPVTVTCIPPETLDKKLERLRREGFEVEERQGEAVFKRSQFETPESLRNAASKPRRT